MFSMLTTLAGSDRAAYGRPLGSAGLDPEFVEQLVTFTSCGLNGNFTRTQICPPTEVDGQMI
jgi:hypothetical protein